VRRPIEPKTWDIVISCFEPLSDVTGGIGSYSRLLLLLLSEDSRFPNILAICSSEPSAEVLALCPNVQFVIAPVANSINDVPLQYIGDVHFQYSFGVSQLLGLLYEQGHRFRLIEFPDYGIEGYFTIKNRRHGRLEVDNIAVRLHSPHLMLWEDNQRPLHEYSAHCTYIMSAELYCYEFADIILYGADAMLSRIESLCHKFGVEITSRSHKLHHPFGTREGYASLAKTTKSVPKPTQCRVISYVGRLENRKGISLFFKTICSSIDCVQFIRQNRILFRLIGKDLDSGAGRTNGEIIRHMIRVAGLAEHVEFVGNIAPRTLFESFLPASHAFVFPSIFENYPNALIETLHLGLPTLVSDRGGMPEVAKDFDNVIAYDPLSHNAGRDILCFLKEVDRANTLLQSKEIAADRYEKRAAEINKAMLAGYREILRYPASRPLEITANATVGFVIPYYNNSEHIEECLNSIFAINSEIAEILIVDDCSREEEYRHLEEIVGQYNNRVKIMRTEKNSGPSCARNLGARNLGEVDYIQFLDADDMIEPGGFVATKSVLDHLKDVDMVYGIQRAFGDANHYWLPRDSNALQVLEENIAHSAVLIRRSAFELLRGYQPDMRYHFEDWEFYIRYCLHNFKSEVVLVPTQIYRVKAKSRTNENQELLRDSRAKSIEHGIFSVHGNMMGNDYKIWFALAMYASKYMLGDAYKAELSTKEAVRQIRHRAKSEISGLRLLALKISLSLVKKLASSPEKI
jgi:glycosyltransferase involved in cell wall biosynthesis